MRRGRERSRRRGREIEEERERDRGGEGERSRRRGREIEEEREREIEEREKDRGGEGERSRRRGRERSRRRGREIEEERGGTRRNERDGGQSLLPFHPDSSLLHPHDLQHIDVHSDTCCDQHDVSVHFKILMNDSKNCFVDKKASQHPDDQH